MTTSLLPIIFIPKNVCHIGNNIFKRSLSLTSIIVDPENQYFKSIDGVLFTKDVTTLLSYPINNPRSTYTAPENTITLSMDSMVRIINLKNLIFNKALQTIKTWSLVFCGSLESIIIPGQLHSIHEYAFYGCIYLKKLIIYSPLPPEITSSSLDTSSDTLKVYVPNEYFDLYMNSKWGKYYSEIMYPI